jgi:hypothetical protein
LNDLVSRKLEHTEPASANTALTEEICTVTKHDKPRNSEPSRAIVFAWCRRGALADDHSQARRPLPRRNEEATAPVAPSLSGPAIVYQHRSGASSSPAPLENTDQKKANVFLSITDCAQQLLHSIVSLSNSCGARDTRHSRVPLLASLFSAWDCDSGSYRSTSCADPPDSRRSKHPRIVVACYFQACSFAVHPRHQCKPPGRQ